MASTGVCRTHLSLLGVETHETVVARRSLLAVLLECGLAPTDKVARETAGLCVALGIVASRQKERVGVRRALVVHALNQRLVRGVLVDRGGRE